MLAAQVLFCRRLVTPHGLNLRVSSSDCVPAALSKIAWAQPDDGVGYPAGWEGVAQIVP